MTQATFLNRIRSVLDRQPGRWEFASVGYRDCVVNILNTGDQLLFDCPAQEFVRVVCFDEAKTAWYQAIFDGKKRNDAGVVA